MNISLLGPTFPYRGGIAHYTTLLASELSKSHDVQFLSFSRQYPKFLFPGKTDKDPSQKPLEAPGADYCLDSMNPLTWIATAFKVANLLGSPILYRHLHRQKDITGKGRRDLPQCHRA